MDFKTFLKQKRLALGMSQADVAQQLSLRGQETSSARVGHWETGRNKPPLENTRFRNVLAAVLQMDVNEMMEELGYIVAESERSQEAVLAASIVDDLPDNAKELALDYLLMLQKRFVHN